jgi:hypothetical protein
MEKGTKILLIAIIVLFLFNLIGTCSVKVSVRQSEDQTSSKIDNPLK